jgi:hypothetical protein
MINTIANLSEIFNLHFDIAKESCALCFEQIDHWHDEIEREFNDDELIQSLYYPKTKELKIKYFKCNDYLSFDFDPSCELSKFFDCIFDISLIAFDQTLDQYGKNKFPSQQWEKDLDDNFDSLQSSFEYELMSCIEECIKYVLSDPLDLINTELAGR